jgi:hypothetical protein
MKCNKRYNLLNKKNIMPKIEINIPHALTPYESLKRIQNFLPDLVAHHSDRICQLIETWSGNTGKFVLTVSGFRISGIIDVGESVVLIKEDRPFPAFTF